MLRRLQPCSLAFVAAALLSLPSWAQPTLTNAPGPQPVVLTGADRRPATSLNGDWHFIADPYFTGLFSFHGAERNDGYFLDKQWHLGDNALVEYSFASSPTLHVPGDWNTQRQDLYLYEGPLWYQRSVVYTAAAGKRTFLHVGAANYQSYFWVNGKRVCDHEGGFTTFDCDVTSALKSGSNDLVAAVDNTRHPDDLPTLKTDWWNYGGLTRSLALVSVPQTYIEQYDLHLDRVTRSRIEGWVQLAGPDRARTSVTVSIPELHLQQTIRPDAAGRAILSLPTQHLKLWSPQSPTLYKVDLTTESDTSAARPPLTATDVIHDELGFRTIETRGSELLLNGQPIFLRGIDIHAEAPFRTGRAANPQDFQTLLGWAKELNCNFVRLAHYPHDEAMTRLADKLGLLVWSEIPVYWAVEFSNPAVLAKAKHMLHEEIDRDRNRASIILWSVANETPATPARTTFLSALAEEVHAADPSRLVTAALLVHSDPIQPHTKLIDDPLGKVLDVIGFNEYIGWYEGTPDLADQTTWQVAYNKPLIVSEFGGGAKAGLHGPTTERWTEEYQAAIYRHQLPMLNRIPGLRGTCPWVLMDFRSPSRLLPGIQDDFNRKGLISDQGKRKLAFSILQQAYRDPAFGRSTGTAAP